ncbi:cyclic nucleotide-binding domain-containing protein [Fusobacterium ulcerans]
MIPYNIFQSEKKKLQHNTFSPGEIILYAETENDYVHFLIDGMAEAYIPNSQGGFSTVHIYKPGSFFGEAEQFYTGRKLCYDSMYSR